MAFKTFTVGEIFTASDANTMFMKQVMIVCTSGTRPSSPAEGWHIYETDTDRAFIYSGSAWEEMLKQGASATFTPTWASSGTQPALGNGTILGRYYRVGRLVTYYIQLTMGSTTTYGTGIWEWDFPVTRSSVLRHGGGGFCLDSSAASYFPITPRTTGAAVQAISAISTGAVTNLIPFTWATGDEFSLTVIYETSTSSG